MENGPFIEDKHDDLPIQNTVIFQFATLHHQTVIPIQSSTINCHITNWKDPPFLMVKSTISMAIFQFAFCMFARPGIKNLWPNNGTYGISWHWQATMAWLAKMAEMAKMEIQTVNIYLFVIICILCIFCWVSVTETGIQATTTATTTGFNLQNRRKKPG
jgi:hypothetical protein